MRKTTLFIAMSLDGFIADKSGGVERLAGQDEDAEASDSYSAFIEAVDTVLMGWCTYDQIITELSPDAWPYSGLSTYVFTHREAKSAEDITFTDEDPSVLLSELKEDAGKDIWICGGANLVQQLVRADPIDRYYISVIPILLGSGIRLFDDSDRAIELDLVETRSSNGIVDLVYDKRKPHVRA